MSQKSIPVVIDCHCNPMYFLFFFWQIGLEKIRIDNLSQNDERRCTTVSVLLTVRTSLMIHVLCMELSRLIASRHIGFCFNFSIVWVLCWIVSFFFLRGWGCDILRFLTPKKTSPNVHEGRSYMAPEPFISTYF